MSAFDLPEELGDFTGTVPLFPLPNAVLFPHVLLPLHVFEPRYRAMTVDVLNSDRLLAIGLLQPGFEAVYETKSAPVHPMVGLGRVVADQRLPDGRHHLVLRGLARARLLDELDDDRPYRTARLEPVVDEGPSASAGDPHETRVALVRAFRRLFESVGEETPIPRADELLHRALDESFPLGMLCDVLAHTANLPPDAQQRILAERNVERRTERVRQLLDETLREREASAARGFPPAFSVN